MKESSRDRSAHFPSELNPRKANPEKVNEVVPKNFVLNVLNGTATKLAEQLASPGLILPWLLVTLSTHTALTGLLVPVRQAGALLPQLVVSGQIRRFPVRKWLWVSGGTTQALALLIMAAAAAAFSSLLAGLVIIGALALFSVARGVCSVTFQDLTGKTIPKGRRGRLLSTRAAAGGSLALIAGLIVRYYIHEGSDVGPYIVLILSAAVLWVLASIFFVGIEEEPETSEQGRNPIQEIREGLSAVRTVPWFRQFLLTRCFLLSLELAVPFFALHAREIIPDASGALGTYMISLALASVLSSPFWGRFADISSRKVMMRAAGMGSIAGLFALSMGGLPGEWRRHLPTGSPRPEMGAPVERKRRALLAPPVALAAALRRSAARRFAGADQRPRIAGELTGGSGAATTSPSEAPEDRDQEDGARQGEAPQVRRRV